MEEKNKDIIDNVVVFGFNLLPYIGGSLASIYTSNREKKKFERIKEFYEEISSILRDHEQSLKDLNMSIHDEDSLIYLIESIHEQVERENRDSKKRYLQNFFINTLTYPTNPRTFDKKQYYLNALSSLTELECEMLAFLFFQKNPVQIVNIQLNDNEDPYVILGRLNRLRNYGFIKILMGDQIVHGRDNALYDLVHISEVGKDFANYCLR